MELKKNLINNKTKIMKNLKLSLLTSIECKDLEKEDFIVTGPMGPMSAANIAIEFLGLPLTGVVRIEEKEHWKNKNIHNFKKELGAHIDCLAAFISSVNKFAAVIFMDEGTYLVPVATVTHAHVFGPKSEYLKRRYSKHLTDKDLKGLKKMFEEFNSKISKQFEDAKNNFIANKS